MHWEELSGLYNSSLHDLLCLAHYIGKVSDDWQVIYIDDMDLALLIELGFLGSVLFFGGT